MATLSSLPADWPQGQAFKLHNPLSEFQSKPLEPVGPHYLAHSRRTIHGRTFSEDEKIENERNRNLKDNLNGDDLSDDSLEYDTYEDPKMLKHDPKDWKSQDHYKVLGISKYRWRATQDDIRKAHRRQVLRHHPDKKGSDNLDDDSFFKCIQKSMELLSDPVKRRQFDSVDEAANVHPPSSSRSKKASPEEFFKLWDPVFKAEARFSKSSQPPVFIGDINSSKEHVDNFYNYWYSFDSWRTFEYLDEDVPDDSDNRDNKRHIERKNKASRAKHKTEDTARLRQLVDDCLSLDPRIKLFKEAERKAKEQRKWEREAGARQAAEEAKRKQEEEKKLKEQSAAAEKEKKESNKKAKEQAKNARKKSKRTIKSAAKDSNYLLPKSSPNASDPKHIDSVLNDVDLIIESLDDLGLSDVASKLSNLSMDDSEKVKLVFTTTASDLVKNGKLNKDKFKHLQLDI